MLMGASVFLLMCLPVPSPPPVSGGKTWPTSSDFPEPHQFVPSGHSYPSGKSRGSEFKVSDLT